MTSIETGPTWSERLDPRNWTLAWKLVVVGLVPALLALVLGVLRVSDQAGEAADLGRSSRLLEVQQRVAGAADALRQERDEATLFVAGNRVGDRGVLEIGFGQADGELDEMLNAVRGTSELDPTTSSALQQTEGGLSQLAPLRTDAIENATIGASQVRTRYDDVVEGVDVLDRALLRQLRTPGVAGLADALTAVTSADEQLAVQHTVLGAAIRANRLLPGDATDVAATDNQVASDFRQYQVALTPEQLGRFGNFLDDAANAQRERLKAAILATPADRPIVIAPNEWDTAYNGSHAAANRSADLLRNELVAVSVSAEEKASNLAGVNSVILMLGLLLGIAVAVLVARALLRSLRVLRTSALDVAERRLPLAVESMRAGDVPDVTVDPVPLSSRDEVGQVARAFDAVHGQAIRLAADQAALQSNVSSMFVNLSRRSQALVERQLQLIEQLESNEQDPDQLSNLFQLDHLATRMRRNSENLLVLAGTDLAKRNIAPVPMVDVLRAAVSEIEQYQRIVVQTPPTTKIVGRAASDLVHLLAELLDNATNFSPPDSQVVMSTARTADGSIVIEIADRGVGMADHELSDANQRLSGPSTVDVSASRRMGLFVVGRLGARHGVAVRLLTSAAGGPGAGLTASVTVPAHLVPSLEPADVNRPIGIPQHAGAAAQGGWPGTPSPQRGVNGTPRTGGLSALIAGTDGPANPASVFDAPAGKDSQLFTPPPSANGAQSGTPSGPQSGLPSRRPGSTLRPGGPPQPPDLRGQEPGAPDPADRSADEQAREVAAQARRDQATAAARARGERVDEQQAPSRNGVQPEQQRNGVRPDTAPKEEQPPKPAGSTPATGGPVTSGKAVGTGTPASGEARSEGGTPGRREGPSGAAPAEEPAAGAAKATPARPEQGATEQARTGAQPQQAQPEQAGRPEQARTEQARTDNRSQQKRPDKAGADNDGADNDGADNDGADNDGAENAPADKGRADATRADKAQPDQERPAASEQAGTVQQGTAGKSGTGQTGQPGKGAEQAGTGQARPAPASPAPGTRLPMRRTQPAVPVSPPTMPMPLVSRHSAADPEPPGQQSAGTPPRAQQQGQQAQRPVEQSGAAEQRQRPAAQQPAAQQTAAQQTAAQQQPAAPQPVQPAQQPAAQQPVQPSAAPRPVQPAQPAQQPAAQQPVQPSAAPRPVQPAQPAQQPAAQQPVQPSAAPRPVQPAQPAASRPAEPSAPQDGLFAPSVPVIAEPGARGLGESRQAEAFDLGETTPIFEEIASAWFRSNRPLPVDWQAEQGGEPEAPKVTPRPSPRPVPRPKPSPAAAPAEPAPEAVAPAAPPSAADPSFASLADEGWAAASGMVAERPDELTAAGLPKRRPRARLIPGSAGSAVLAPPAAATRSAENIRGRLASYQQGVRQGRESKLRGEQGAAPGANGGMEPPATAGGNHDEESS